MSNAVIPEDLVISLGVILSLLNVEHPIVIA